MTANNLVIGNILDIDAEAIVNASDKTLTGGGGIDKVIHKAAGNELKMYLAGKKLNEIGDAIISPGFKLKQKYIIHTVGPRCYKMGATPDKVNQLFRCYRQCLELARQNGIKSIAFPCISTGVYHFPKDVAANIAIDAVTNWLKDSEYNIQVYFVCYSKDDAKYYTEVFKKLNTK